MRRLGLGPTRRRPICAAQCPQSFRNKKKTCSFAQACAAQRFGPYCQRSRTSCPAAAQGVKGFATQENNNDEVRNVQGHDANIGLFCKFKIALLRGTLSKSRSFSSASSGEAPGQLMTIGRMRTTTNAKLISTTFPIRC
jgi:hypothetical protein